MNEKHYAIHLKNNLDAAAIDVRTPRTSSKSVSGIPLDIFIHRNMSGFPLMFLNEYSSYGRK